MNTFTLTLCVRRVLTQVSCTDTKTIKKWIIDNLQFDILMKLFLININARNVLNVLDAVSRCPPWSRQELPGAESNQGG